MSTQTPAIVALDAAEESVIVAARALRHLPPPPGRINTTQQMIADDLWYAAYHRLLDALDRLAKEGRAVSDIDLTEAVRAAARALHDDCGCIEARGEVRGWAKKEAEAALHAALPLIERQVREQVAREIETRQAQMEQTTLTARSEGWINGLGNAARIARGES